jgi:hypothetical protein
MGMYLTGVCLTGMHLTGVCLMGTHLIGVYFMSAHLMDVRLMSVNPMNGSNCLIVHLPEERADTYRHNSPTGQVSFS